MNLENQIRHSLSPRLTSLCIHRRSVARHELKHELSCFIDEMATVRWKNKYRELIWSFKEHELLQADSFATTWNNFLGRTTSRPGDRHQIMAAMQDFKFDSIYSLKDDANARMKAILKGNSCLPLALLFSPSAKFSSSHEINAWAPELPQGTRLDCSLGYMKVFTDCLFVLPQYVAGQEYVTGEVTVCVLPAEVSTFEYFQIASGVDSDREQLWIEMEPLAGQQPRQSSFTATCMIFPNSSYRWKSAQIYESEEQGSWCGYESRMTYI